MVGRAMKQGILSFRRFHCVSVNTISTALFLSSIMLCQIRPSTSYHLPPAAYGYVDRPFAPVETYELYNRCSGYFVQAYKRRVDAKGLLRSPLITLVFEPCGFGSRHRIRSALTGRYICLTRRLRLRNRQNGRNRRCTWTEHLSDNYFTELRSHWATTVHIGFDEKGRAFVDPYEYFRGRRHCFQFAKIKVDPPKNGHWMYRNQTNSDNF